MHFLKHLTTSSKSAPHLSKRSCVNIYRPNWIPNTSLSYIRIHLLKNEINNSIVLLCNVNKLAVLYVLEISN
jgi:hypothetical protein